MSPLSQHLTISVLAFGVVIIAAIVNRNALRRIGVPPLVGFVMIGLLNGLCDHFWPFMDREIGYSLHLLGELGLFALLFGGACVLFSRFAERPITRFVTRVMLSRWPNETVPEEDSLAPRIANRPID